MDISRQEIIDSIDATHWYRLSSNRQNELIDEALKNHTNLADILSYINARVISIISYECNEVRQVCGGC